MQTITPSYRTAYEQAVSLRSLPRVIFEWNHNRFSEVVTASNAGSAPEDNLFPIKSIAYTMRGKAGLVKARVGEARVYDSRQNNAPQYRTVGERSNYKYFSSGHQSLPDGTIAALNPQVVYGSPVKANKIVVGLETTWARPTMYTIYISYDGNDFSTVVGTQDTAPIDADGRIVLYLQPNRTTWGTTESRPDPVSIKGVRFLVTRLDKGDAHFNMIELSARLEKDLSEYVMSASTNRSTDEHSQIFPVGVMNSNTASVQLDNTNKFFDRDNTASPYYGLIDSNAEVQIAYGTDVSGYGGGFEYIKQGTYFVDSWGTDTESSTIDVTCTDVSKFFQAIQMYPVLFQNRTPGQIIAEILSSVGFRDFAIDTASDEYQARIPYVWFTAEDNVWSAIQSICQSVQGTVYTDEAGIVRFVSRDKMFANAANNPVYTLTAENIGNTLANLSGVGHSFTVEANKVTVNFTPLVANSRKIPVDRQTVVELPWTRVKRYINRREYDITPIDSVLWKPEGTVTLRASELLESMTTTSDYIMIPQADATWWPWNGFINIEGEVVSYDGKEYRYWKNNAEVKVIVKSKEEQKKYDEMESDLATIHKNHYTGRLVNVKRGLRGTPAAAHVRDLGGWKHYIKRGTGAVDYAPLRVTQQGSEMVLWGQSIDNVETYLHSERGSFSDKYRMYGTRMRFANTQYAQGTAGLFFHMQSDRTQGYYVEINLTRYAQTTMKGKINEVRVYRMQANGSRMALPDSTKDAMGLAQNIVINQWVDIDVTHNWESNTFNVFVNGRLVNSFRDPQTTLPPGNWGTFVRGHSVACFEYFYVANRVDGTLPDIQEDAFMHKVTGGFVSGFADREMSRASTKYVNWFMDDFGPWCHEMREFNVEFDKVPALDANIYVSNDWDTYVIESNRTAFDATFWIANSGRDNAVISGEDPTVYVGGGDVKQQMLVFGQLVTEDSESSTTTDTSNDGSKTDEDENTVVSTNEYSIRRRGTVELTIDSKWIQSRSQAEALGDWITKHWSEPVDTIEVEGFFNPALQLGDLVALNYPDRNMRVDEHRYHVVGLSFGIDTGIKTSLTLRRVRGS